MSSSFNTDNIANSNDKPKPNVVINLISEDFVSEKLLPENYEIIPPSSNNEDHNQSIDSLNSSNGKVSTYLLEQIAGIKDLLKTQEQMIEKYYDEEISAYKGKDINDIHMKSSKEDLVSADQSPVYGPLLESEEFNQLELASVPIENKKLDTGKNMREIPESIVRFIGRHSKLRFVEKAIIFSHLLTIKI
ncbi:hypothetical protein SteCoe_12070 [Stentor coeruleus]|uniref:Uncharacterized protein n=1 Tax=Stentor coeruleus TaxID=5963 RepID=A0A1R2CBQ4_9CILI|nr:hypothetical protein SteCoe_12070 [Stentor coeruleus]